MERTARIVVALLAAGGLAACGSAEPPRPVPAATPTGGPAGATPAGASDGSAGPPPASPTAQVTFDQAVVRFLKGKSGRTPRFVGLCADAKPDPGALCAARRATVDEGEVYGIGAPYSEVDAFLLMRRDAGGWRVVDSYVPGVAGGEAAEPPAPAWFRAVG
ncbi:hypothetical protein C5N14_00130 [Micromonospora sp. MW-13]|uniref:hypothetical protein n=1 Tax=unclassified Micromonospora TaxID=2617518 RepID=UPI000E44FD53|nr:MULTISPECIES: hypothetical protein [unclassified Micromonospora]MCX4469585.1 hypothetical protein [Micromonospora sp. NBC_01655]RGC70893.1 hypothetical protein C5N14_00130 [Micromonospora sp. MW-13]